MGKVRSLCGRGEVEFLHSNILYSVLASCSSQPNAFLKFCALSFLYPQNMILFGVGGEGGGLLQYLNFPVWSKFTFYRRNDLGYIHARHIDFS